MENSDLQKKFLAANKKIKSAKNILIATHVRPDGDCLSSACALSLYLEELGKKYQLFCADGVPEHFSFIPNVLKFTQKKNFDFQSFDLIIIADCGCMDRTGLADEIVQKKSHQAIIEFDHHPKIENFSDLEIRLPKSSSTAEILYLFFRANDIEISKKMSDCLLTGVVTDTGNLLFSSVNEETIKTTSSLLLEGASMPKTIKQTSQGKGLAAMKILGIILENIKYNSQYDIIYSALTYQEVADLKKEFGENSALEAASDILNNAEGAKAALFLREEEPGKIKGSLRSKHPDIDVSKLAAILGGGGHPKAAAFRLDGQIEKTANGWRII